MTTRSPAPMVLQLTDQHVRLERTANQYVAIVERHDKHRTLCTITQADWPRLATFFTKISEEGALL